MPTNAHYFEKCHNENAGMVEIQAGFLETLYAEGSGRDVMRCPNGTGKTVFSNWSFLADFQAVAGFLAS